MFGVTLAYLAWINLVLICSMDVELNPGPVGATDKQQGAKPVTRQATLSLSSSNEFSLMDVMAKLNTMDSSMNSKLDTLKQDMQSISDTMNTLQTELNGAKEQIEALSDENMMLRDSVDSLTERINALERQTDNLENRSRRNNILFYGLDGHEGETNTDCEQMIKELCTDRLELAEDLLFDRVHRVGTSPKAPIIAKLTLYKQKVDIMKCKSKLKGTDIFVGDDYSKSVREVRKKLAKVMKEKKANGDTVSMVFDHLIVNGKKCVLAADGVSVVEVGNRVK